MGSLRSGTSSCSHLSRKLGQGNNSHRLVATLGSRSIAKRLNKKAILDVDVSRACNVITNPEAPMALRLQGSLL